MILATLSLFSFFKKKSSFILVNEGLAITIIHDNLQVIGTWDDHDYGLNDAGKEYSGKVFSQRLMLDFLDEAEDSSRYICRNT